MKTLTIISLASLMPLMLLAQVPKEDLSWVDEQVEAIKPPRVGLNKSMLMSIKDPFKAQLRLNQPPVEEKNTTKKSVAGEKIAFSPPPEPTLKPLTLQTIMNRSSVKIDGKWYRKDDKIYGYTITSIEDAAVLLQRKKKQVRLSLVSKNDKIKINAK